MWKFRKINSYQLVIHSLLVLLGILVWALANQNENLKQQLRNSAEKIFLKIGEQIENFEVYDLHGNKQLFITNDTLDIKEKLLFFFTADCPFCTKNIENWKSLHATYGSRYEIYGIGIGNLDEINEYIKTNALPYKVVIPASKNFRKENKIGGVPLTVNISKSGVVKNVWIGTLDKTKIDEIISIL